MFYSDPYYLRRDHKRKLLKQAGDALERAIVNDQQRIDSAKQKKNSPSRTPLRIVICTIAMLIFTAWTIVINVKPGVAMSTLTPAIVALLVGVALTTAGVLMILYFKTWTVGDTYRFGWDEQGIVAETEEIEFLWRWKNVKRWCETDSLIAYQVDHGFYGFIPKAALDSTEYSDLCSALNIRCRTKDRGTHV